jgi:hypothetical protein
VCRFPRKLFSLRRLLPLLFAGSTLGLAAGSLDSQDLFRGLNSPWVSAWALADFDGDSQIDLASASSGRHDERGYAHEVSIHLSGFPSSSFKFRNRYANVQLVARDMDGDHDRDIVILDASSMEPVGIWLNDGSGHFEEGDLANFRDALSKHDRASFECLEPAANALLAISEQRVQPAVPRISIAPLAPMTEVFLSERGRILTDFRRSDLRSRAPPVTS